MQPTAVRHILCLRQQREDSHWLVVVEPDGEVMLSRPDLTADQVRQWLRGQRLGLDFVGLPGTRNLLYDVIADGLVRDALAG